ncbi:hypothetical protein DRQ07_10585, partial [candidate division KSB1 bacterium]
MKKKDGNEVKLIFLFVLCLSFIVSGLFAGTKGKIAGRVIDSNTGKPLIGANIIVVGTNFGATSNEKGNYVILNLSPGMYSVKALYMGYQAVTKTGVMVIVDRTTRVNFSLKTETIAGESVVVVAKRPVVDPNLTATEHVVRQKDIDKTWVRSMSEIMNTQTGVYAGHVRGGTAVETKYMLDNVSLNSGLLSDNYTGVNTSAIQEVSILTGGYNAEYGDAQSGIVNIVTKEGVGGIHGTWVNRMRPAGKYHWGRNMYSHDNYEWTHYDIDYWTALTQDETSEFYGSDPNTLLKNWQDQHTANPDQADYTKRPELETEMTLYGSLTDRIGFLISGRYKRGVNVFPQATPYNPEFNFQGNITYKLSSKIKLKLSGIYGGYTNSSSSGSNFYSIENSQEMAWNGLPEVTSFDNWSKYDLIGGWVSFPEKRRINNVALEMTHVLNPQTFYKLTFSYLNDNMDKTDRDGIIDPEKWSFDDDVADSDWLFLLKGYKHWTDMFTSKVYSGHGSVTSQIDDHNQVKAGFEFKSYDLSYDHQMSAYEGGERWNLMNVYQGKPYEGSFYTQDKMEFSGLIVNAGIRVDYFNQNRDAPKNMFDPLAYEETTPGNIKPGFPGVPERESTKTQFAVSPRLGISHPISENTVLHFVYGHFYQRPSWHKMLGFPYINFTEDPNLIYDPYNPNVVTYMDQWQGYYGNPKMGYERTIQYEIGVDQNIANLLRLDITGYYKDASRQTIMREGNVNDPRWGDENTWTTLYNAVNQYNVAMMISNCAYADVRGLETELNTRFNFPLNFNFSYDLSYSTGGVVGYSSMYELGTGIDAPYGYGQSRKSWNANNKFKGIADLSFPKNFGPSVFGFKPLSEFGVNIYFEYRNGPQYTYHGPDDTSTEPNNKRWYPHYRTNLTVSKGFDLLGFHSELRMEVRNLFNNKDINMLGWD